MTTRLLGERLGLSYNGTKKLLSKLSTAVPLVFSEVDQRWRTVDDPDQAEANGTDEKA
jgi:hypothetical protein